MSKVQCYHAVQLAEALPVLEMSLDLPHDKAMTGLYLLGRFNGCLMGISRFSGQTRWERHAGEELLHILEGATEIRQRHRDGETILTARVGDVVQIPANVWHTQRTLAPVKLLFITPDAGNDHHDDPVVS